MIKTKTFKAGDEAINDFMEGVMVINNGIHTHGDNITVVYREDKHVTFGQEEKEATLYQLLFNEKQALLQVDTELAMMDRREKDEHHGRDLAALKSKKTKTEVAIEVIEGMIAEL